MSNLPVLPDVEFAARDSQTVIDNVIGGYEELTGRKLAESDPVRLFLLSICYVIIQERAKVDAAGKSNLLYYAEDDFLDHIGALRRTPRIDRKSTRLNSSHVSISYAVFCLKKQNADVHGL